MSVPSATRVAIATLIAAAGVTLAGLPLAGQTTPPPFKVAYYNIKSGFGQVGLSGAPVLFAATSNCTDPSQPLNAWGMDVVQAELRARIAADPAVVVLGLSEAWSCATPAAVQQALGWPARTGERNGTMAVARYGFAGPEEWLQLDTTQTSNPRDTRWVLRVPVCLDAGCARSVLVYVAHSAPGAAQQADQRVEQYLTVDLHARQATEFMTARSGGVPHVLLADLNVFEGTSLYCGGQPPYNSPLQIYRQAGYLDVWPAVHGADEGFTGMWNRAGCGQPAGNLWKRIDFAWSRHMAPIAVERFGMVAPGMPAPSDHAGLIVTFPHPDAIGRDALPTVSLRTPSSGATVAGTVSVTMDAADDRGVSRVELIVNGRTVAVDRASPWAFSWDTRQVSNGTYTLRAAATDTTGHRVVSAARTVTVRNLPAAGDEVVLHAGEATAVRGTWNLVSDPSAASGQRLQNADLGAPRLTSPRAAPDSYVEFTFYADAGRPYRLWLRGRATHDSPDSDSVFVQFDSTVSASGAPTSRIGSTSATTVQIEDCTGCGLSGWGWQDNATGRDVLGPLLYFAHSGPQRLRIQAREDGLGIDQIVLSSTLYRWRAPGALLQDATVLPSSTSGLLPPGPSANVPPSVVLTSPAHGTTVAAPATLTVAASAVDPDGGVSRVEFYADATRIGIASAPPYAVTWTDVPAGRYTLTAVATDNEGAMRTSAPITIDVGTGGGSPSTGLPAGWSSRDIGTTSPPGSASGSGAAFTVSGAGADIWGTADAFHFAYRTLAGDGIITARVASLQAVDVWSKAGVMMRETLQPGSRHAMVIVSPSRGLAFQRRVTTGGVSTHTHAGGGAAPAWVRLTRTGSAFEAFVSSDGVGWTSVGRETIPMAGTIHVGLPVTSHRNGTAATATFDSVTVAEATSLPSGWSSRDIGTTSPPGSASGSGTAFTVSGAGADIWGTADAFHFAYRTLAGDGTITARVASLQAVDVWSKAGVMMRETLQPGSRHAMVIVSPSRGLAFQRRVTTGGVSTHTHAGGGTAPAWVRLTRTGSAFEAFVSSDGVGWTSVGRETIPMAGTIHVGLPVTSHRDGTAATATFDSVTVAEATSLPSGWSSRDIGTTSPPGSASGSGTAFTVSGAGADIWGTTDAFHFVHRALTGDGVITARVASLQAVDVWSKAGVMMRETLHPGSRHVMMIVSPSRGLAFQRRVTTGGVSTHTHAGGGTAPAWVRLTRAGDTFSAHVSTNGTTWTLVDRATIAMPATIHVGLPVTSHANGTLAQATFDSVSVQGAP